MMKIFDVTPQQVSTSEAARIAALGATTSDCTLKSGSLKVVSLGVAEKIFGSMKAPQAVRNMATIGMFI